MVLVIFLFWLILFLIFFKLYSFREALVWTMVIWNFILIVLIETLSQFKLISYVPLGIAWGIGAGLLALIYFRLKPNKIRKEKVLLKNYDLSQKGILIFIGLVMFFTFITALLAPPNNDDGKVYHMARVAHWAQNHSIAHYQTFNRPQLSLPPAAEIAILNYQVLLGNDYLANFVQWLSMFCSIIVITLLTAVFGANQKGQVYSALLCATIPMGIMQATSVQNDYFAAFWILTFAYFVIKSSHENTWPNYLGAGITCGIALLSKPTAYFFVFPFLIWLIIIFIKKYQWNSWKPLLLVIVMIVTMNFGHYYRNIVLFKSPTGPTFGTTDLSFSLQKFSMKITKYAVDHFHTPFPSINNKLMDTANLASKVLQVDINDPGSTQSGVKFEVKKYSPHEDLIGNPVHFIMIFVSILLFPIYFRKENGALKNYFYSVAFGSFLFFLLIRYQPWMNRLALPIFVLFSPILGIIMQKYVSKMVRIIIVVLVMMVSIPPLMMNVTRPIIPPPYAKMSTRSILSTPRDFFFFSGEYTTYDQYREFVQIVKKEKCNNIGLMNVMIEYPIWVLLKDDDVRIEHIEVINNVSSSISSDFKPEIVLAYEPSKKQKGKMEKLFMDRIDLGKTDVNGRHGWVYLNRKGTGK